MIKAKSSIRFLALILLLALMCTAFSGCGVFSLNRRGTEESDDTTNDTTALDTDSFRPYERDYNSDVNYFLKYIGSKNYSGGACKIVVAGRNIITPDENTSAVMAKDFNERNNAVRDYIKLSIVSETTDIDTMYEQLRQSAMSGSYYADVILAPQSAISTLAMGGYIANLRSLPSYDYNAPFLYNTSIAAGAGGEMMYAAAGPASLEPDALHGIFFNKDIIAAAGLESPYDLVDRGEWTADKFAEYIAKTSAAGYGTFGAERTSNYLTDLFYFSFDARLTEYTVGQYPTLALNSEASFAAAHRSSDIVNSGSYIGEGAINAFSAGNLAFLAERLDCVKTLANSPCNWGLLPLPKYNSEQSDYKSLVNSNVAMFFAVPISAPDYSMSGDVINAVNIMSYGYTRDAYADNAAYYYLRDNQSIRMMSIILENPVYDGAYTFGGDSTAIEAATYGAIRNNTYGIASVENSAAAYAEQFASAMYNIFSID